MTYSIHFRKKVLKLLEAGESYRELSERFKISTTTISRWRAKLEPEKSRNKKSHKIAPEALRKDVEEYPDAYGHERAVRLGVSASGIRYAKKLLGITYKKNSKPFQSGSRKKGYFLPKNR